MSHKIIFNNVFQKYNIDKNKSIMVLKNLSFKINESEFVSILGPSGCGKTTIINLLAGFIKPSEGKILVDDKLINSPSAQRTVIFQEYALFPWKTVGENIGFGLKCLAIDGLKRKLIIKKIVKLLHLQDFINCYPCQLSGGMKQKVALGRALAIKPEIILMDEPFASIDQQTRESLQLDLLEFHASRKMTVVFVTHDIDEAIFLSDRIIILSPRPSEVRSIIRVPLIRPRKLSIYNSVNFIRTRKKIQNIMKRF